MIRSCYSLLILICIILISCKNDGTNKALADIKSKKKEKSNVLDLRLEDGNHVMIYDLQIKCLNKDDYNLDSIDLIRYDIIYQASARSGRDIKMDFKELVGKKLDVVFKDTHTHSLKFSKRDSITNIRLLKEIPACKEEHNPLFIVDYVRKKDKNDKIVYSKIIGYLEFDPSLEINWDAYFDRQANQYNFYHTSVSDIRCGLEYLFE